MQTPVHSFICIRRTTDKCLICDWYAIESFCLCLFFSLWSHVSKMEFMQMFTCNSCTSVQVLQTSRFDKLLATWNIGNQVQEGVTSVIKELIFKSCAVLWILIWPWIDTLRKGVWPSLLKLNCCKGLSFSLLLPITVVS